MSLDTSFHSLREEVVGHQGLTESTFLKECEIAKNRIKALMEKVEAMGRGDFFLFYFRRLSVQRISQLIR
jgi:hypothetical protein